MENRYFSNNATTTISSLSGTTLVVASAARLPSQYPYFLTLENTALTREIVKVTASPSANTLTIVRAQEGTTQFAFAAGDKVELRVTAGTLNGFNDKVERSGDTLTGTLKFKTGANGGVEIRPSGTTSSTGYVHLTDGSDNSIMFFGATPSSGGFITSQPNATTSNFSISVPTTQVTGDQLLLTTNSDGKTRIRIGSEFIPRCFTTGSPLPTVNIGPIWHDDYQDWMIWQRFDQNGANYVGYASRSIGRIDFSGPWTFQEPTIGKGVVEMIGLSLSKTTYAALWNWAVHNLRTLTSANWTRGQFAFADNGDGTFKVPSIEGEFLRIYDPYGVIDVDRAGWPGWQGDAIRNITGTFDGNVNDGNSGKTGAFYHNGAGYGGSDGGSNGGGGIVVFDASRVVPTSSENRPRNVVLVSRLHY